MDMYKRIIQLEVQLKSLEKEKDQLLNALFSRTCISREYQIKLIKNKNKEIEELKKELRLERRRKLEMQKELANSV